MVGSTSIGFSELVMVGEIIEVSLKLGIIQSAGSSSSSSGSGKSRSVDTLRRKRENLVLCILRGVEDEISNK